MTMKLHCFGESGNAYKAALTLTLSDAEWEPVFVDFFNGATRTPAFRALNVMGEVPVLVDGDLVLTQSGVIQDYVSSKTGKLGGRSAAERREVLRWMFFDNHKLSGVAGGLRWSSPPAYEHRAWRDYRHRDVGRRDHLATTIPREFAPAPTTPSCTLPLTTRRIAGRLAA